MVEIMHSNILELFELREDAYQGGGKNRIEVQHRNGKLTARERIDLLLDEGSFEEIDILKRGRSDASGGDSYPGEGVIASVMVKPGDAVESGMVLIRFRETPEPPAAS